MAGESANSPRGTAARARSRREVRVRRDGPSWNVTGPPRSGTRDRVLVPHGGPKVESVSVAARHGPGIARLPHERDAFVTSPPANLPSRAPPRRPQPARVASETPGACGRQLPPAGAPPGAG